MKGGIAEIVFAASLLETDFNNFTTAIGIVERQVAQPVMHIQTVTTAGAAATIAFTAAGLLVRPCTTSATSHRDKSLILMNEIKIGQEENSITGCNYNFRAVAFRFNNESGIIYIVTCCEQEPIMSGVIPVSSIPIFRRQ
jgi:hypothetical protein